MNEKKAYTSCLNQESLKKTIQRIKESYDPAPRLIPGASFHGEVWYKCPACNKGIEAHSIEWDMKQERPNVYLCPECGEEFFYRRDF